MYTTSAINPSFWSCFLRYNCNGDAWFVLFGFFTSMNIALPCLNAKISAHPLVDRLMVFITIHPQLSKCLRILLCNCCSAAIVVVLHKHFIVIFLLHLYSLVNFLVDRAVADDKVNVVVLSVFGCHSVPPLCKIAP